MPVKFLCPAKNEFLSVMVQVLFVKRRRIHGVEELIDIVQVQLNMAIS